MARVVREKGGETDNDFRRRPALSIAGRRLNGRRESTYRLLAVLDDCPAFSLASCGRPTVSRGTRPESDDRSTQGSPGLSKAFKTSASAVSSDCMESAAVVEEDSRGRRWAEAREYSRRRVRQFFLSANLFSALRLARPSTPSASYPLTLLHTSPPTRCRTRRPVSRSTSAGCPSRQPTRRPLPLVAACVPVRALPSSRQPATRLRTLLCPLLPHSTCCRQTRRTPSPVHAHLRQRSPACSRSPA